MNYTQKDLSDIIKLFHTDKNKGLTSQQVAEIQAKKGLNKFEEGKKETILEKVLHHLAEPTSIILLIAVAISTLLAIYEGHSFADPIVILSIVLIDTFLAVFQETSADKAIEALKNINADTIVVIRDGEQQSVEVAQLVPGDILILEAGDLIPADARIIDSVNMKVDESTLTGESLPVEKDATAKIKPKAPLGDRLNMLFSGCLVTSGRARAVVVETGMGTEIGKIAGLLNKTRKTKTPLQKKTAKLGKNLTIVAVVSATILFVVQFFVYKGSVLEVLMSAVALAVAAVPETLPVIITITLAFGVRMMAKKNAIIRKISAVETLGSTSVICSDKTGTLTMNRMTIQKIWATGHQPIDAKEKLHDDERILLEEMALVSNATIYDDKEVGDPTETAIIRLLNDKGLKKSELEAKFPKIHEIPFDSERKLMTTVREFRDGDSIRYISITKGAFDMIPVDESAECLEVARSIHDKFAEEALRVLAVGYKYYDELPKDLTTEELEKDLDLRGFVGMIDPPRPESLLSVKTAAKAGIRTVMITGDHAITATAIARQIGILSSDKDKTITGAELAELSYEELRKNVQDYCVYARVTPEDKIRIVQAWKSHGEVVAMTGDGVNDAPALRAANVGIAMGSGTDVSKNASDVILTDDNFATIIGAVREGRRAYDNIRKAFYSLVSDNFAEIIVMLFAVIRGWGSPLVAIQLLYINVIADGVPDMFFYQEKAEDNIMGRKPNKKNSSLFADGLGLRMGVMAVVLAVITLIGFYLGSFVNFSGETAPSIEVGRTMAFLINAWSSVINSFNIRSYNKSLFKIGIMSNPALFWGIMGSIGLTAVVATVPFLAEIFYCAPLSWGHWLVAIGLSIVPLIVGELHKLYINRKPATLQSNPA